MKGGKPVFGTRQLKTTQLNDKEAEDRNFSFKLGKAEISVVSCKQAENFLQCDYAKNSLGQWKTSAKTLYVR